MIEYYVSAKQSNAHIFDVKVVITQSSVDNQRVSIANWTPGSYLIRDFARHVISLTASQGNTPLKVTKINSNTWDIENHKQAFVIDYQVYAYDSSVRGAYLDEEQGFINGAALFLKIHEYDNMPHQVHFDTPWQYATTLPAVVNSYNELIDHPVQLGAFERYEFDVLGIPHSLVITGTHDGDIPRLIKDVQKICENQINMFGKPAPFEHYLFLLTVRKEAYGGLEHRSSTALQISRECMPLKGVTEKTQNYISLLALFSHEYFHSWNVKKITPLNFEPYDLNHKAYTSQLWAFEGITSYYDDLTLVRSKVISLEQYLDIISQNITKLLRNPGRKKQTLVESSFDAWIKFYQPNENSANALVSYYLKGSLVALAFDLYLRKATENQSSLDDVMKQLWERYGKTQEGVPEGEIERIIMQLGGKGIETLVQQSLYGTDDLPFAELLAPFGLELCLREALSSDDQGGKRDNVKVSSYPSGSLHCAFNRTNNKVIISTVYDGGVAQTYGLCPQDEIIAINGLRVDAESFEKILKRYTVGQTIELSFFRQDQLKNRTITLQAPKKDTVQITVKGTLTPTEKNNLNKWLMYESNSLS